MWVISVFISFNYSLLHIIYFSPFLATSRLGASVDELDDLDLQKLVIVAQCSPSSAHLNHHDRTGDFTSRCKMTDELAQSISDGLYFFEQVCVCMCVCVCARACVCVCACVQEFITRKVCNALCGFIAI